MEILVVLLPLLGAFLAGVFGRTFGDKFAQFITCAGVLVAMFCSIALFFEIGINGGEPRVTELFTWISSGDFHVNWSLRIDTLTTVMLIVVTIVSSMVHLYSIGYMSHDPHKSRFMAYLSLFTFAMLMLVTADNLLQMFFGWEGVGVASYLLINFWFKKDSANNASMKAFLVNRVGDFGFALGIMAIFVLFGSVEFATILDPTIIAEVAEKDHQFLSWSFHGLTVACLLLFIGAMGKSAQLGLHTWLPDAMEGPTPVSALIHAATMVTAGVFMVARLSPIFEFAPIALGVVTILGALTAIVAATIGMTQFDIKRVIAYSTMSQLGYMFFALGVSAYGAAMFHLMTHAFFKALLFLGAGSVIHALSDEQDMRKMGGVWKMIPITHAMMWIGSLALAGIPLFAGYYSKDIVLESAWASHSSVGTFAYWMGIAAALLTAFYSWRLIILTFYGEARADEKVMAHIHESPKIMTGPLLVLALGAIFSGWLGYSYFVGEGYDAFWNGSVFMLVEEGGHSIVEAAHHVPAWVKYLPLAVASTGILLGYLAYMFVPGLPEKVSKLLKPIHTLFFRKYFFDEIYNACFVKPALWFGRVFWKAGDEAIINGLGPDGIAKATQSTAKQVSKAQSGFVYHYAFAMVIGVVVLIALVYFWGPEFLFSGEAVTK